MSGPLLSPRLAAGAFRPGSERLCAMDLLCSMLGEPLTGFPSCSARPLARMVQALNDGAAEPSGILGEEAGRRVFDIALSTVGTGELDDRRAATWMADVLGAPWGVAQWADPDVALVVREVAAALRTHTEDGVVAGEARSRLRLAAQEMAWSRRGGVGFAVADAAVYGTWADLVLVGARAATAASLVGDEEAELLVRSAIARWRELEAGASTPARRSARILVAT